MTYILFKDNASLAILKFVETRFENVDTFPWNNLTNLDLKQKFEILQMSKGSDNDLTSQVCFYFNFLRCFISTNFNS